jgi:hypothetical protein
MSDNPLDGWPALGFPDEKLVTWGELRNGEAWYYVCRPDPEEHPRIICCVWFVRDEIAGKDKLFVALFKMRVDQLPAAVMEEREPAKYTEQETQAVDVSHEPIAVMATITHIFNEYTKSLQEVTHG